MNQSTGMNMAIDPICDMTVDQSSALRAERDGQTFYFCSDDCRQKFMKAAPTEQPEAKSWGEAASLHLPCTKAVKVHRRMSDRPRPNPFTHARCTPKCSRIIPAIAPSVA